jgi:hypothetical protein
MASVAGPVADGPGDLGAGFFPVEISGGFTHSGSVEGQFGFQVAGDAHRSTLILAFDQLVGFPGRLDTGRCHFQPFLCFVQVEIGLFNVELHGQQGLAIGRHDLLQVGKGLGPIASGGKPVEDLPVQVEAGGPVVPVGAVFHLGIIDIVAGHEIHLGQVAGPGRIDGHF